MGLTANLNGFNIEAHIVNAKERYVIRAKRTAGSMLAYQERPEQSDALLARQTWLVCADCAAEILTVCVTEVERAALRGRNSRAHVCESVAANNGHSEIHPAADCSAGWGALL